MADSFAGKKMSYKTDMTLEEVTKQYGAGDTQAIGWRNRRPICPYGCGEEGNLLEVVMEGDKAVGIYTHRGSIKPFTADLQMSPKPTGKKLQLGPDGEYHMVEDV